ncbi:MAG: hypothetical protein QMD25_05075 [Caldisericia bacterium]|nr:hypothetical protein [Caldisericia bacterium]
MYKRDVLNNIFEDYIIYRELNIVKKNLPNFLKIKDTLSLNFLPRKKDKEYVKVLSYLIELIGEFKRVIYIGDTFLNDKSVVENLTALNKYEVFGIITEGKGERVRHNNIIINNRWENLKDIFDELEIKVDKYTIFIVDIDKTIIGAKGRNDLSITKARFDAIKEIANEIIGNYDEKKFFEIYQKLNEKKYHSFTEDNQDIVTLLTILFYLDLYPFSKFLDEFEKGIHIDKLTFLKTILKKTRKSSKFIELLKNCILRIENYDQTPFIEFRYKEFEKTIKRMDFLNDETPQDILLEEEIMITREVYEIICKAKDRDAKVLGLSDKPEASSFPQKGVSLPPIHLKSMKIFP